MSKERKAKKSRAQAAPRRWLKDYEVEHASGGVITAKRLREDRVNAQFFPFHRVGRTCWYDLTEINAAIEASKFGGKAAA